MKIEFKVESFLDVKLDRDPQTNKSREERVARFCLEVSENLDINTFIKDGSPTKEGCVAIRETLVASLAGSIHYAHQNGMIDSAENLRAIIAELEKLFVTNGKIGTSEMIDGKFKDDYE